jgi:hypothetical protein
VLLPHIRAIESRKVKLAGHAAHLGEKRNAWRVLLGRHKEKRLLGRPWHVHENDIKWILNRNRMGEHGLDSSDSQLGHVAGFGEESSEP